MNDKSAIKFPCLLCGRSFGFGEHRYDGRRIQAWDIMVCNTCYGANWDGIVPGSYPRLDSHFKANGISPQYNAKGYIEWPKS